MALITGANGLLGSHLVFLLLQAGEEVFAIKREQSDTNNLLNTLRLYTADYQAFYDRIHWIKGDVLDGDLMDQIILSHKEVYHTAAFVSFHKSDHQQIRQVNVEGTINIVEACRKHQSKLVYVSSIAALGRGIYKQDTTENDYRDSSHKSSVYSQSKFEAEQEVWRGIAEGLNAVIVNPSVILGPGDWSKSSAQLFSTVKNGLKFYTNGSNGYVDVRDVATIMHQLMKSNLHSERYILSGENLSYKTLFEEMATALGVAPPSILAGKFLSELSWRILAVWAAISGQSPLITKETAKSANDHYRYSSKKICQVLNFNFTPIKQTIQHTANAYLGQIKPHV